MSINFDNLINDIRVDLTDEFDRNFERKAFFTQKWHDVQNYNNRGSLLLRSGALRASILARTNYNSITWYSSLPYAAIHNEGGQITVTAKMKRFFWAKYMELSNGGKNKTNQAAQYFKAMALKSVGSVITMPSRRFVGFDHPAVHKAVKSVSDNFVKELAEKIINENLKTD